MPSSSHALQQAVFAALSASAGLVARLGAPRIFDGAPQGTPFPYLTFGQSRVVDWSTGTESGAEHQLTLHVWSRAVGRRECVEIMSEAGAVLHDASLGLDGHHLVNLRLELREVRREPDGETWRGLLRFRATTEPA